MGAWPELPELRRSSFPGSGCSRRPRRREPPDTAWATYSARVWSARIGWDAQQFPLMWIDPLSHACVLEVAFLDVLDSGRGRYGPRSCRRIGVPRRSPPAEDRSASPLLTVASDFGRVIPPAIFSLRQVGEGAWGQNLRQIHLDVGAAETERDVRRLDDDGQSLHLADGGSRSIAVPRRPGSSGNGFILRQNGRPQDDFVSSRHRVNGRASVSPSATRCGPNATAAPRSRRSENSAAPLRSTPRDQSASPRHRRSSGRRQGRPSCSPTTG